MGEGKNEEELYFHVASTLTCLCSTILVSHALINVPLLQLLMSELASLTQVCYSLVIVAPLKQGINYGKTSLPNVEVQRGRGIL